MIRTVELTSEKTCVAKVIIIITTVVDVVLKIYKHTRLTVQHPVDGKHKLCNNRICTGNTNKGVKTVRTICLGFKRNRKLKLLEQKIVTNLWHYILYSAHTEMYNLSDFVWYNKCEKLCNRRYLKYTYCQNTKKRT